LTGSPKRERHQGRRDSHFTPQTLPGGARWIAGAYGCVKRFLGTKEPSWRSPCLWQRSRRSGRMPTRKRIPQEAKAWGNAQDRLTWGRSPEGGRTRGGSDALNGAAVCTLGEGCCLQSMPPRVSPQSAPWYGRVHDRDTATEEPCASKWRTHGFVREAGRVTGPSTLPTFRSPNLLLFSRQLVPAPESIR
jgi:hypothetical protein